MRKLKNGTYYGITVYNGEAYANQAIYINDDCLTFDFLVGQSDFRRPLPGAAIDGFYSIAGDVLLFRIKGRMDAERYSIVIGQDDCFLLNGDIYRLNSPPPEGYEFVR